jgi:predicted  nucleic acid-binding Zn-ribbon protein
LQSDLFIICALWEVDHASDLATLRLRALKQAVDDSEVEIVRIGKDQVDNATAIASKKETEAKLGKELDAYVRRRERAAKLMKGGGELDYEAVGRQQVQCGQKVDVLELEMLASMEAMEEMQAQTETLSEAMSGAITKKDTVRNEWVREGRLIGEELKRLASDRVGKWTDFPHDIKRQYEGHRRRRQAAVVNIVDGSCEGCSMNVNAQILLETRGKRRLHSCRGCFRWFRGVVDTEPLDESEEDV